MYSKEQITFLMQNGFSLDEIMQMQNPDPQPEPQPQPQPEPRLNPGQNAQLEQLIQQNNQLIQLIQRGNINGIQFGSPQPERSVDDILAEVINPPIKK